MKERSQIYSEATRLLKEYQQFHNETLIGVPEGIWKPKVEYPDLPFALEPFADQHFGSIHVDYDLLDKHWNIVEQTPNYGAVTIGDDIDNFIALGKIATGTYENPLPPQLQAIAYMDRLEKDVKEGKVGAMAYGNHNNFGDITGYDWLETWARKLPKKIPIFTAGGLLHLKVGSQVYDIAMTHRYWGRSQLNPTNMVKRFMEYEYPDADVYLTAHTHQGELLTFDRAGEEKIGAVVGTYKLGVDGRGETWARQMGIGGRAGRAGMAILFYPNEHKMVGFRHTEDAQQFMLSLIHEKEWKGQKIDAKPIKPDVEIAELYAIENIRERQAEMQSGNEE